MAAGKWIGGFLGLLSGGPIGALAGFVLGALFDTMNSDNGLIGDDNGRRYAGDSYQTGYAQSSSAQGTRNGFLFSLLTLASYIIRADGKVMHSEMEAIRQFLRASFGEATQPGTFRHTIIDCCGQLREVLDESQRLQLLSLLVMLAKADGHVATEEIAALREVTAALGLSEVELNSMLGLGSTSLKDAYAVLEISENATDEEVKAAYKRMVVKHHPDRVASLGDDIRLAAEKKMREINEARDIIFKARGL